MKMYLRLFLAVISLSSCMQYRAGKGSVAKIVSYTPLARSKSGCSQTLGIPAGVASWESP